MLPPLLVALAADASESPTAWFINYGVAGGVILLFVFGLIRTKAEVISMQKTIDEKTETIQQKDLALEQQRQANNALTEAVMRVLPAVSNVSAVVEALPRTSESQLIDRLAALTAQIESVQRKVSP